jgi:hypothetical protein
MGVQWHRPFQSPRPRLQNEVPRRVHFLEAEAGRVAFCAHSMDTLTILSRLRIRQQVMVRAPLRHHPRLGPETKRLHLLASLRITSRTFSVSVTYHARTKWWNDDRMTLAQRLNELAVANSEGLLKLVSPLLRRDSVFQSSLVTTSTAYCDRIYLNDSPAARLCRQKLRLSPILDHVRVGTAQLRKADVSERF